MTIEVTAKKIDDAINQGLKQLGATLDEVNVEVVDAGGLFRKAKVRLTLETEQAQTGSETEKTENESAAAPADKKAQEKTVVADKQKSEKKERERAAASENASADGKKRDTADKPRPTEKVKKPNEQKAKPVEQPKKAENKEPKKLREEDKHAADNALAFVKELLVKMGFADATVEGDGERINITAPSGDDSLIIGRHGETLSAIGYLAETGARAEKCRINITVDCNGYRDRRAASLTAMAKRRADECVAKHRRIKLEPMERADRRTVHYALTDDDRVVTASEGKEPHRFIVIMPKDLARRDKTSKPDGE